MEGFEVQVLRGLSHPIPVISLEYHCDARGQEKVTACLDRLSALGTCEVNLIGQEDARFLLPKWFTVREFIRVFPDCAMGNFWGDLFVKVA